MTSEAAPHLHRLRTEILPGMENVAEHLKAVIDELAARPEVIHFQTRLNSDDAPGSEIEGLENGDVVQAYNHARDALTCLKKPE